MPKLEPESWPVVKRLLAHDRKMEYQWDEFVMACPNASFFHRSGWQKIVLDIFHHTTYFLYAYKK
jgi:hypothetical protein